MGRADRLVLLCLSPAALLVALCLLADLAIVLGIMPPALALWLVSPL